MVDNILLRKMKGEHLHQELKNLIQMERRVTHQVLLHIREVDRRKLHLEMAFPSLFAYLTEGIGYSAASAQRRIDAARMMNSVPDLGKKIESGTISLSQVCQVRKAIRQYRQTSNMAVSPLQQQALLIKLESKSSRETERILAQEFCLPIQLGVRIQTQRDDSVRIELTLSKEQMQDLEQARALLSHALPNGTYADIIAYLASKFTKQKINVENLSSETKPKKDQTREPSVNSQTIPASTRNQIFLRDQVCQFRDPKTGKKCRSKYFLELDHIQPRWAMGNNSVKNLRVYCSAHNKFRYQKGL